MFFDFWEWIKAMSRRIIALGILPAGSNPVAPVGITAPTLTVTSQTTSTVVLFATGGGGTGLTITAYVFQSATALGGPYTLLSQQSSATLNAVAPTTGLTFYYRVAVIVSDGRQTDWSAILTVTTGTTTGGRRYAGSHYVAISPQQISAVNGIPHAGTITNTGTAANPVWVPTADSGARSVVGPVANNVTAVVVRYNWNELNPTGTTYDWSRPDKEIAQCATFTNGGVLLFMMIIVRTFDGRPNNTPPKVPTNPLPTDLQSKSEVFTSKLNANETGIQGWRWSPTVLARFSTLCQKIGQRYNANVNFGGMATQETSTGSAAGGSGADAYSLASYKSALVAESNAISSNCPNARHLFYLNAINTGGSGDLKDVAAQIKPNGAIVAGPDLVLGGSLTTSAYKVYRDYHAGTNTAGGVITMPTGIGATMCAIQSPEWTNQPPAAAPTATVRQRFLYGQGITNGTGLDAMPAGTTLPSLLNLDGWIPDWDNGNATPASLNNFNNGATDMMAAFPTFGSYTP